MFGKFNKKNRKLAIFPINIYLMQPLKIMSMPV